MALRNTEWAAWGRIGDLPCVVRYGLDVNSRGFWIEIYYQPQDVLPVLEFVEFPIDGTILIGGVINGLAHWLELLQDFDAISGDSKVWRL